MSTRTDVFRIVLVDETGLEQPNIAMVTVIQIDGRAVVDSAWLTMPTPTQIDTFRDRILPELAKDVGIPYDQCHVAKVTDSKQAAAMTRAFFGGGVG